MAKLRDRPLQPKYFGNPSMMRKYGAKGEDRMKLQRQIKTGALMSSRLYTIHNIRNSPDRQIR